MAKHVDCFGRKWNHVPSHNPDRMIQVPPDLMHMVYQFDLRMKNCDPHYEGAHAHGWPVPVVDCYLLKGDPSSKYSTWYAGIRLSDEPSDYLSPGFEPELIWLLITKLKSRTSLNNFAAIQTLTGSL